MTKRLDEERVRLLISEGLLAGRGALPYELAMYALGTLLTPGEKELLGKAAGDGEVLLGDALDSSNGVAVQRRQKKGHILSALGLAYLHTFSNHKSRVETLKPTQLGIELAMRLRQA